MFDYVSEFLFVEESVWLVDCVYVIGGNFKGSEMVFVYCNGLVWGVVVGGLVSGYSVCKIEVDLDINLGNSGGVLVNDFGEVVGVCEGLWIDVDGVKIGVDILVVYNYFDVIFLLFLVDMVEKLFEFGNCYYFEGCYEIVINCFSYVINKDF